MKDRLVITLLCDRDLEASIDVELLDQVSLMRLDKTKFVLSFPFTILLNVPYANEKTGWFISESTQAE